MELLTAREYLRVSLDKSNRARSMAEQHIDNEAAAAREGFVLKGEAYEDPSVSASRYSRKARDGYDRLTADLQAGRFGADILIIWESSRGSRRVGEWATLVDLLEDAGVRVHVSSHGTTYDPANPRHRRSLMEDAVDSEYESGKLSMRVSRAMAANAAEGKPHGRVPYGYKREYEVRPNGRRELTGQVPEPEEAAVIGELFRRLDGGDSLRAIAADFDRRGIRTRTGKPFASQHLRELALNPAYGGYRVHRPGNSAGKVYTGPLPAEPNGTWPPLTDRARFFKVRALLLDPGRKTSRPGRGKHLLSMIAVCGVCGGQLSVTYRRGDPEYTCRDRSCVRISKAALDEHAEDVILAYLAQPDVIAKIRAPGDNPELNRVRGELGQARAELAGWRAAAGRGKVTPESFAVIEPPVVARITALETAESELSAPGALLVIPPGKDVAMRWKAAPMPARRQVARLLCAPAILGTLRLGRSPSPGHPADPADRVTWDRDTP